jgi:hypothetical protein
VVQGYNIIPVWFPVCVAKVYKKTHLKIVYSENKGMALDG